MKINMNDFFRVMPGGKRQDNKYIFINPSGRVSFNRRLMEAIETNRINLYMANNYKMVVLDTKDGVLKVPKTGAFFAVSLTREMTRKKIELPVQYKMEWDDKEQCFIGKIEEVISLPNQKKTKQKLVLEELL